MLWPTYLQQCLKEGRLTRWPAKAMPIHVYIAPFSWYEKSKQQDAYAYNQMVLDALRAWSEVSNGTVRFQTVYTLNESQIDIKWRRVDRKSLGHCLYSWDKEGQIYSAEIEIGLSDGILHARYNDMDEVRHTILHEVGHALGITGHSPYEGDIMYVPHQYGVTSLSSRDVETLKVLYELPIAYDYLQDARELQLNNPQSVDEVIAVRKGWIPHPQQAAMQAGMAMAANSAMENALDESALARQQDLLHQRGLFYLSTAHLLQQTTLEEPIILPPNPYQAKSD